MLKNIAIPSHAGEINEGKLIKLLLNLKREAKSIPSSTQIKIFINKECSKSKHLISKYPILKELRCKIITCDSIFPKNEKTNLFLNVIEKNDNETLLLEWDCIIKPGFFEKIIHEASYLKENKVDYFMLGTMYHRTKFGNGKEKHFNGVGLYNITSELRESVRDSIERNPRDFKRINYDICLFMNNKDFRSINDGGRCIDSQLIQNYSSVNDMHRDPFETKPNALLIHQKPKPCEIRFAKWKKRTEEVLSEHHKKLTPLNSGKWGNVIISSKRGKPHNIIYEYTFEDESFGGPGIDKKNSTVFGYEPYWVRRYPNSCFEKNLHFNNEKCWMPQDWTMWINKSYDELLKLKPKKSKNLSIILSQKTDKKAHKLRHKLVSEIESKSPESLDIWGNYCEGKSGKQYKGECRGAQVYSSDFETGQEPGIEPYRYYIATENGMLSSYFSEKICIPYLFLTMPFYWGCPSIDRFFPKESYIKIDIEKKGEAERIIELSKSNIREENIDYLMEAKDLVMNKYNAMATINMSFMSDDLIKDFC